MVAPKDALTDYYERSLVSERVVAPKNATITHDEMADSPNSTRLSMTFARPKVVRTMIILTVMTDILRECILLIQGNERKAESAAKTNEVSLPYHRSKREPVPYHREADQ